MSLQNKGKTKTLTVVELLVVVLMLGVLSALVIPNIPH